MYIVLLRRSHVRLLAQSQLSVQSAAPVKVIPANEPLRVVNRRSLQGLA